MATQQRAEAVDGTLADVTRNLAGRVPLYRWRSPAYRTALLRDLRKIWRPRTPARGGHSTARSASQ